MSTDDFQTKYACFMDTLVKSTVAETTRLFETVVDELKAELSKVKTENEALKTTCRQIADAKTFAIREYARGGRPQIQDNAVQCDLLPCHFLLIEQPVGPSVSEQGKQCTEQEMVYILINDNDVDAEKGAKNLTVSLPNHEHSEPTVVSGNTVCAIADPPLSSACQNETIGPKTQLPSLSETPAHEQAKGPDIAPTLPNKQLGAEKTKCGLTEDQTECEPEVQVNEKIRERKQHSETQDGASHGDMKNSHASPTAPIPQAPSPALGIPRRSAVMVQDAMLLIEAMAQSKNRTSALENPIAQDWCSRPVVTSPSVVKSQVFSSQSRPTAKVSDKGAEEVSTNQTLSVTYTTASSSCPSHIRVPTEHQQKHGVGSSDMTLTLSSTAAASGSLEQRAPHTQSMLAEPLQTMVLSEPAPQKVFSKSPCTRPQRTIAPPSPNQITAVMSTVAPAQNKFTPIASSSSELSQRKNDVTCAAAAPLDMSDTEINSPEQGAGPEPCKNIKIAIRRATDATRQPQQSEIPVASRNKNSVGPGVPVSSSSHRPNAGAQVVSDENKTPLASGQTPLSASPQVECSSTQASVCESFEITPGEQAAASSSELVPAKSSPLVPIIRLKRLPNLASATGSFLVSQLFCHGKESGVVPPDGTSSLINEQASTSTLRSSEAAALSTSLHPNLEETSVGEIRKTSEKASPCSAPEEAPPTGLSACTPSCGSESVLEKATTDFDKVEFPAVTDQARKTGTVDEGRLNTVEHNFVSPNGSSTTSVHSSPISKHPSEPHLQSTEAEFFSQLELLPINQDAEKITTIESADAQRSCVERTSTDGRTKSDKKSIVTCPGFPLKTYSRTKRTKTNSQPHTSQPCFPESPKKPRLENVSTTEQVSSPKPISTNTAIPLSPTGPLKETEFSQLGLRNQRQTNISCTETETVSVRPRKPVVTLYRLSLKDTTDSTSIIAPLPRARKSVTRVSPTKRASASGSLKIGDGLERVPIDTEKPFRAEEIASAPVEATVCPRSSSIAGTAEKAKTKSAPLSRHLSGRPVSHAVSEKSGDLSESPRSGSTKVKLCVTQTTVAAVTTGKPSTNEGKGSPKKLKATKVCLWSNTTEGTTAAFKTKLAYQSPKTIACVKKTNFNCPRDPSAHETTTPSPPRKKFTRDDKKPKKSQLPPVSQNESRIIKYVPRPQTSNCESKSLWICNLSELENSKRTSNSLMGKSVSPSNLSPKLTEIAPGSSKTGESTAKTSRMNQKPTVQDNAKEQNAKKLAPAAKANPIAKIKQTKSNIPKQRIHHHASNQTGNKCTSQTMRTPPKMQAGEATQAKATPKRRFAGGRHLRKNQCGECGRILSSKTALESHVSVHTGHRPFSCTLCDKSFPDSRGLKRHSIVHRNGRLHVCQQCGKGFVYGFGLAKHVQMVHGKIKPFVCQVCNKSFFTKRDVETHIRVHTGERPFPCHLCEKKFSRSVELNAHLRWHRGEKRHWCPYCGKGFFDQNNLKRHKYIHTGEKPHSCPHCPKHFTQSGHLKKHVKNVHKVL